MAIKIEGKGEVYTYLYRENQGWRPFAEEVIIAYGVQRIRPSPESEDMYYISITDNGEGVDGPRLPSQKISRSESYEARGFTFSHYVPTPVELEYARLHQGMLVRS